MNPTGLVGAALNYLNPIAQNIGRGAVNIGRNMVAGIWNTPAQAINQTLAGTNQALQQNKGNPLGGAVQATESLAKNTLFNKPLLAEETSFAVPFGRGTNFLTKSVIPGAASGAIYQAGQPGATPKNIGENAVFGGATAGLLQGMGELAMKGSARLDALTAEHPEIQAGKIDFNAPIGGTPPAAPEAPTDTSLSVPAFHGEGGKSPVANLFHDEPIYGKGKYYSTDPAYASIYGKVAPETVGFTKPLVVANQNDLQEYMNQAVQNNQTIAEWAKARGFDGIYNKLDDTLVKFPQAEAAAPPSPQNVFANPAENSGQVRFLKGPQPEQENLPGGVENVSQEQPPLSPLGQRMEAVNQATTLKPQDVANPNPLPGAANNAEKSLTPSLINQHGKDLFTPNAKAQTVSMFQKATTEKPILDNAFSSIAKNSGAQFDSRIKAPDTMLQKIVLKRSQGRTYDLSNVNDIYGGRITVTSPEQEQAVLQQIRKTGLKIISAEPVKSDTYTAYHVDFQTPTGTKGEVQIVTPQQSAESLVNHGIRSQFGENPPKPIQAVKEQNAQIVKNLPTPQAAQVADALTEQAKANPELSSQPIALKPPQSFLGQRMEAINQATAKPTALSQFESSVAKNKAESIAYFDQNGNKLYETKPGGSQTARIPTSDAQKIQGAAISSHNHVLPDPAHPDSIINQVASEPNKYDISQAINNGVKEVRTVTPNGTIGVKLPTLDKATIQTAMRQSSIDGENAFRASLARGESPYMANVMRVKAENDSLVQGLGATKTGGEQAGLFKAPAQTAKPGFLASLKQKVSSLFGGGKPEKPTAPPPVPETGVAKERGFVTTVKQSPQAPQKLKDLVSGTYNVKANTDLLNAANQRIAKSAAEATHFATTTNSDEATATAIQLVKQLSAEGNHQAAADIVNTKAEQLTEAGRTIQAASLFDNLSPEGVGQLAARTIQRYNIAARNKIPELSAENLKAVQDMAAKVQSLPDGSRTQDMARQQLMKAISQLVPSSFLDKSAAFWRAGLLTGPQTITKIGISHAAMLALEQIKNIPAAAADNVISLFSKQRGLTLTSQGLVSGGKQGINDALDNLFHGYEAPNSGGFAHDFKNTINFGNSLFGKAAQAYVDTVGRIHGSLYKPFYGAAHMNSLYDQALTTATNQGLEGTARDNFVVNFIKNPTPEAMKVAERDASYATFQQKTILGQAASSGLRPFGAAGKFLAPFTRIASAVITDAVDYTPVGAMKPIFDNVGRGQFTQDMQRQLSQSLGRSATGTGLVALGALLYNKGMISLDRPKAGKAAAQWDLEGRKPQSVLIDGQWKNLASLGPLGNILGIGGYFQQGLANAGADGAIRSSGLGLLKITLDQPYLMGVSNLEQAVQNPQQAALTEEKSLASSVVPTVAGTVARAIDPLQRETNTPAEAIQAKIPFLRQNLIAKTNVFGQPLPRSGGVLQNIVDPFQSYTDTSGQATNDVVTSELGRLNAAGFPATPAKLSATQTLHGVKAKLTPQQLDAVNQTMGPQVKDAINQLIQTPKYKGLTDEQKAAEIGKTVAKVHATVTRTFNTANPKSPLPKYVKPSTAKGRTTRSKGLFSSSRSSRGLFSTSKKSSGLFHSTL